MNDKIITHEDLEALELMRDWAEGYVPVEQIVARLIAAAEADKPALPEGWVLLNNSGKHRVLWHDGTGYLRAEQGGGAWSHIDECVGDLTPLATAASIAPEGVWVDADGAVLGEPAIIDGDDLILLRRRHGAIAFDVLAALITAAQAERGQS